MIQKSFDAIDKSDIDGIVLNQVREERTIEYKLSLPGNSDDDKREFLANVSSFANASGGDLLYGVEAVDGIPMNALGLTANLDTEILRLENLLRDGLEPRVQGIQIKAIEGFSEGPVILVRIPGSWGAPHMIKFKNLSRFYTRNTGGKHQMDVSEIRSSFLLSETLNDKIRGFRDDRLGKIVSGETPVQLPTLGNLVLHVLPVASFVSAVRLSSEWLAKQATNLIPLGVGGGYNHRFNLDGFVTFNGRSAEEESRSYCLLFRTGQIEAVLASIVREKDGTRFISSHTFETYVVHGLTKYLEALKNLEVPYPLMISLALTGVSGARLYLDTWMYGYEPCSIERDTLVLPDVFVEDAASMSDANGIAKSLRIIFDAVWNASGLQGSINFDKDGNWQPK